MSSERDVDERDPAQQGSDETEGGEHSLGSRIEPGDAVPDEAAPSQGTAPPGPDPSRVIEEKGRTDRGD